MKAIVENISELTKNLFNISSSDTSINTSYLKFSENKLITKSQEMYIEAKLKHDIKDCVIMFDKFQKLLESLNPKKEIEIVSSENFIKIKHKDKGKIVAKIPFVEEEIDFPKIKKTKKWEAIPKNFFPALSFCKISLSKESINWILTYFGIFEDGLITTDENRCSYYPFSNPLSKDFVLSSQCVSLIENLGLDFYHVGKKSIEFKSEKYYIKIPLLVAEYPKIKEEIFEKEVKLETNRIGFLKAIERCKIFASGESLKKEEISIVIQKNKKFEISSKNDFGSSLEKGRMKSKIKEDIEMIVNPSYLIDILKKISSRNVIFYYSSNRIIFEQEEFKHVIALNV